MRKLGDIHKSWIYTLVFAVVFFSILVPIALPVPVQPETRKAYQHVNSIPAGSNVFIWSIYSAGATAELNPMLDILLYNLMKNGDNIVLAPATADTVQINLAEAKKAAANFPAYAKGYGTKWVALGFNPAVNQALRQATSSIADAYKVDVNGTALDQIPLIKGASALTSQNYKLGIVMDDTDGYLRWINYVGQPQNMPPLIGAIQMEVPIVQPYVNTGQIGWIIPGANGAAQYEALAKHPGDALRTQNTASLAAILVTVLLILGNLGYWAERRAKTA